MEKFVTIGIAGHVDHGKTTLVRCLTGIDTDRLREEKLRGLSIESGIAPLELPSGKRIALVDVPGHKDFLKNTIRGLSGVDIGILVVAADDGVMPQTLEHIQILDFFGAKDGFIVLSKADLVDEETLELAEIEIRELIKGTFFEGRPVISFSAAFPTERGGDRGRDRRGLSDIRTKIEESVEKVAGKDLKSPFRLWIDQVKSFAGFGTVVSGTILSGAIRQDDILHLMPSDIETRARSLEAHHQKVSEVFAGQRVGINLHKVPLKEVKRGMVLAEPGSVKSGYFLNVELKVLKNVKKPIKNRQRIKLYLGTSVTSTLAVIMEKEQLGPGEKGLVQFRLKKPVAAVPGDTFVICPLNIQTVIGGGRVIEVPREKYRRARASITIPCLKALQDHNLKEFIKYNFKSNFARLITAREIAGETGFHVKEIESELTEGINNGQLLSFNAHGVLQRRFYEELKEKFPKVVEKILRQDPLKMTATAQEVKSQLAPSLDEAPFQKMLAELCNEGFLIKEAGGFKIPSLSVKLSDEQEGLIVRLLDYAVSCGFVPFSADTFWKAHGRKTNKNEIQRLLDYMHAQKQLVRLNNRRFLSPHAMEQIKERVREQIKKNGRLNIGDCKEVLGYGRTVGVPVFEYLDSIGFTQRQGNERVLKTD